MKKFSCSENLCEIFLLRTLGTLLLFWNLLLFFGIVNGLCVFVLDMFSILLVLFVIIAYFVLLYLLLPLPLLILQLSMGRCVCSPRRQTSTLTTPYMLTCNSLGKPLPANSDIFILLFPNRGLAPRLTLEIIWHFILKNSELYSKIL